MINHLIALCAALLLTVRPPAAQAAFEKDTLKTSAGDLEITFIGHGSLMMRFAGKVIDVDPWSRLADYQTMPRADLILITHEHGDHMDPKALEALRTDSTVVILTRKCAETVKGGTIMNNGDSRQLLGITVQAVPAYNLEHHRPDGTPFHPKGEGNGYILTFGRTRVYIAGDTENTPEMKSLKNIDVAFLPMNLPYTMTPEMVADAAKAFHPKILYPYHFGDTDTRKLESLMRDVKGTEVRIRNMK